MRRRCQSCRLNACYEAGMKSEFVQKVRNETSGKTSKPSLEFIVMLIGLGVEKLANPRQAAA